MPNWIQRMGALFSARPARTSAVPPAPLDAVTLPPAAEPAPDTDPRLPFFDWVLGGGATAEIPLQPAERRLLARLESVLESDATRADLLPRAPAVIPHLMNSLRDERQSTQAYADRVVKDPNLVAEVLRLANGAGNRGGEKISDLAQAISRVGTLGLRRAIARVVLKPIFDAPADSLSGRAAARLWCHSEATAAECMRLAAAAGIDPFDGYLAGLMHNVGWTAALRVLDQVDAARLAPFSPAFVERFESCRTRFFAALVLPWQLTPALTALAAELSAPDEVSPSPLHLALRAADRRAALDMLDVDILLEVGA